MEPKYENIEMNICQSSGGKGFPVQITKRGVRTKQ